MFSYIKYSLTPEKKKKKARKNLLFPLSIAATVKSCFKSCRWTAASVTRSAATVTEKTSKLIKHRLTQVRKSRSEGSGRLLLPQAVPPKAPEVQQPSDEQQVPRFGLRTKKPACTRNCQNVPHASAIAGRSLIDFSRIRYDYKHKCVAVLLHNSVYKKLHS